MIKNKKYPFYNYFFILCIFKSFYFVLWLWAYFLVLFVFVLRQGIM